ncbi:MAG: DUF3857 domain-containing protein [Myxococcota bacterium]
MRGAGRMARALVVVLAVASTACGGVRTAGEPSGIELLRRRAAEHPRDPAVQGALAEAELLAEDGDPSRADAAIRGALKLSPQDEELLLLGALERNLHGDLPAALDRALSALERARASRSGRAAAVAEAAAGLVTDLEHGVPGYDDRVWERLRPLARDPRRAGAAAQALVGDALLKIAFRRGSMEDVKALTDDLGCVPGWRVAGPFGPRELLGFDRRHPPLAEGPMADRYDLGPERGTQPTRELGATGCTVNLGVGSQVSGGGTTYAEAFVETAPDEAGKHVLRLETPNPVEVYLDGERLVRLDARKHPSPRVTYHPVELSAGRHEITVKVTSRHPNPMLDVALVSSTAPATPGDEGLLASLLGTVTRYARGDVVGARERLRDGAASPPLLVLGASVALSDPLRPADVRRDRARRRLAAAARRDPQAWLPELQLARLSAADGQLVEAIERLRGAVERWPGVLALRLALQGLLLDRGWEAEAYAVTQEALERVDDSCPAIRVALAAAKRRDHIPRARELTERLVACDARSDARLEDLVARRRWDEAIRELERLAAFEPPQSATQVLRRRLQVARGRGDDAEVGRLLRELSEREPRSSAHVLQTVDRLHAAARSEDAVDLLTEAIHRDPEAMANLRWPLRALGGEDEIDRWRVDGAEVLEAFEASGRTYDAPQVLVWDYMAVRVFEDGSSLELVHQIHRVQSEEAVDAQGEFSEPDGARLLALHTIKPDGTRLEPDRIGDKDTISLPELAPGDYVEHEYVRFRRSPGGMPGAVLGDRFYFRDFEVPFDRSMLKVAVPKEMDLTVDPRGAAPEAKERAEKDLRVYEWAVTESRPLTKEPMSVSPKEWVPSIGWGIDAEWDLLVEGLVDALADKDVADPAARRLARRIVGGARGDLAKAKRLYAWVLGNVEDTSSAFGQAAPMLAGRTGERTRILRYLLGLLGVEAELVLARSIASDRTRTSVANDDTFTNLLLMVKPEEREPVLLSLGERGAPFGYVPPGLRGQRALVLQKDARWVTVPEGEPDEDRHSVELDVELAADGSAHLRAVETHVGAGAVSWRNNLEDVPDAVLEERFDEQYVARLVPGARLLDLEIEGREAPEEPFVLRYTFEVPILGRRQGPSWILPALVPPHLSSRFAAAARRTTTQVVAPPFHQDFVLRVRVPEGVEPPSGRRPVRLEGPGGADFAMRIRQKRRALVIERRSRVPVMRVSPEDYPAWAAFCRAADEAAGRELPLEL